MNKIVIILLSIIAIGVIYIAIQQTLFLNRIKTDKNFSGHVSAHFFIVLDNKTGTIKSYVLPLAEEKKIPF